MNRRGFIAGAASLIAAPAIVRATSLMPVRNRLTEWGDWQEAAQVMIVNGNIYWMDRDMVFTTPLWDAGAIAAS